MGQRAREKVVRQYRICTEADGIYAVYRELLGKRGIAI